MDKEIFDPKIKSPLKVISSSYIQHKGLIRGVVIFEDDEGNHWQWDPCLWTDTLKKVKHDQ